MKKIAVVAIAACVTAAIAVSASSAGSVSGQRTAYGVTNYVTVGYSTQYCAHRNSTLYKLTSAEFRWYRSSTARRVSPATISFGEVGFPCFGVGYSVNHKEPLGVCWACGNSTSIYWSPAFFYGPETQGWPYVGGGIYGAVVGAWAKYTVRNSDGVALTTICHQEYVVGVDGC
jgi:hypothetical protein